MSEQSAGQLEDGCSIIVPAYNEEPIIGDVLDEIKKEMDASGGRYEIIVVDDGSTDDTSGVVEQKGAAVVRHQANRGYGAALKTGIQRSKYGTIAIIDADGTYPVNMIPRLLEHMDGMDMVVGVRTGEALKSQYLRRFPKWILRRIAIYLSGTHIPDLNSGLRVFKKSVAEKYFNILPSGFSFTTTITVAMHTAYYEVAYVPIEYYQRVGKSKIRPIRDSCRFFGLIFRTIIYFNPLRVFLPLSGVLFLAALGVLGYSYYFTPKIMDASVMIIFMTAIQVSAIGLLADLVNKRS